MGDVQPFLYNLFADPEIIRLPKSLCWLQKPLATFVSNVRAPKSRAAYDSIGGGSPLNELTRQQAKALDEAIAKRLETAPERFSHLFGSVPVKSYVGMRYWHPFTEEALEQIKADGISKLVILPLYPQFSVSTSGSSLREVREMFVAQPERAVDHTVIPYWYQRPGYIKAMQRTVMAEIESYTTAQRQEGVHVLFSAHGVPKSYVDEGDPYKAHIKHCVDMIAEDLPDDVKSHLSFQSRVGPVEWLRPYTDEKLRELGKSGVRNVIAVPISFVSEHIETLEEMDGEFSEIASEAGIIGWRRAPALNTDQYFIDDLANAVIEAVESPPLDLDKACTMNYAALGDARLTDHLVACPREPCHLYH